MDDLSWGTKGLDSGAGNKDSAILDCWKVIKTIHVGKLLFWNVLVAGFLIHFGSEYLMRFYLTLGLMVLIAVTMLFKVFFGILYYFYYMIFINNKKKKGEPHTRKEIKKESSMPKLKVEPSLYSALITSYS